MRGRRYFTARSLAPDMSVSLLKAIARLKRDQPFEPIHFVDAKLEPVLRDSLEGQMLEAIYNESIIQHLETMELLDRAIFEEFDKEKRDEYLLSVMKRTGRTGRFIPSTTKPINPEEGD